MKDPLFSLHKIWLNKILLDPSSFDYAGLRAEPFFICTCFLPLSKLPYEFGYKIVFFPNDLRFQSCKSLYGEFSLPKQSQKPRHVLQDGSKVLRRF